MSPIFTKYKFLALSVFFALVSACSIYVYLEEATIEMAKRSNFDLVSRVVASKNLKAGTRLSQDDLASREFPVNMVSEDSFRLDQLGAIMGKATIADVRPGELITRLHLTDQDHDELTTRIDVGHRAITIPVDQISSLSGLIKPGDKIDLYVSFDHSGKRVTAPLVNGISVLATGQNLSGRDDLRTTLHELKFATLTLSVTPDQAVRIVAARQDGKITAVLSGKSSVNESTDKKIKQTVGDLAGLLGMHSHDAPESKVGVIYGDLIQQDLNGSMPNEGRQMYGHFADLP